MLPEVASLPPEDELDPLFELDEVEPDEFEPLEVVDEVPDELVLLLAVGVDGEVASVSVEVPESEPELELFVEEDVPPLVLLCAALGTVAATASDPAMPLAATIAVIVAVRRLPCRTERAAPSASMGVLRQGMLSIRDPKDASAG